MSAYFQRLIAQSALHIQRLPEGVGSLASAPLAPLPTPREDSPGADIVEIHEESLVSRQLPRPSSHATPDVSRAAISPANPSTASESPSHSSAPTRAPLSPGLTRVTETIVDETIVLKPAPVVHAPIQRETPTASAPRPVSPAAPPSAPNPEIPSDVLDSVMKWIAAGSAGPRKDSPAPAASSLANEAASVAKATSNADVPPPAHVRANPVEPAKIPDRVIEIVEEHFAPPPAPAAPLRAPASASPQTSAPARAFESAPDQPVRISIGTIQVRVEAPAPPPAPGRAARSSEAPRLAAAANRATGFSKLRRHYIIPH